MVLSAGATARRKRFDWPLFAAKAALHAALLVPIAAMVDDALHDGLGADPVAELTHRTGLWALRLLLATLAITPLRLLTGRAGVIRFRRLLGLWAFAYACLHFSIYLVLDLGGYWPQILEDIVKRPFITVGFAAWLLLVPLALTSTRGMMRRLGRRWGQLHRLVYLIGVLVIVHFLWLVKADLREPLTYGAILVALLAFRLPAVQRWLSRRRPAAGAARRQPMQEQR